jgi:hypothetical protein
VSIAPGQLAAPNTLQVHAHHQALAGATRKRDARTPQLLVDQISYFLKSTLRSIFTLLLASVNYLESKSIHPFTVAEKISDCRHRYVFGL